MIIYVDDEIEAATLDEARAKGAALAEEAWHREIKWKAELAARPPRDKRPYDPLADAKTIELWSDRLVREVTAPTPLLDPRQRTST